MWRMLQQDQPDDYVIGTGQTHRAKEQCRVVFGHLGLDCRDHVKIDDRFLRSADVDLLVSEPENAGTALGQEPATTFEALVVMMVEVDLVRLRADALFP